MTDTEILDRVRDRVYASVLTAATEADIGAEDRVFWEGELTIEIENAVQDAINGK